MTALSRSTRHRLQKLRQVPAVWEGDRRPLSSDALHRELDSEMQGECILWVDGTEALVRAMDVVPTDTGREAIVRTLLRAMEYPHSYARPGRPQKIVVRDRELQFFLRGVLQDLDITVDYAQELPLIDEIFRGLQEVANNRPPQLPPEQAEALDKAAYELWHDAPWEVLDEEKIVAIDLNYGDVGTLYVSILGMLGMEYGILMYRSLDSLKLFRQRVLAADDEPEQLEGAFLEQDCFFLTFDRADEEEDFLQQEDVEATGMRPTFGNLHPLEGMRPVLYEEEAIAVQVALVALHRFYQQHRGVLEMGEFPELNSRYRITDPQDGKKKVSVKVSTMPDVAAELFELSGANEDDDFGGMPFPVLRHDLIPGDAYYSLGAMPWEVLELLRQSVKTHQPAETQYPQSGEGLPVVLIQTSRPKAIALIEGLQAAGGLAAIGFNPGTAIEETDDSFEEMHYDLGILQAKNGDLHLFGEFIEDDPVHIQARKKWDQRCKKTKGYCALVIAKGLKGAAKGNPGINDMMALFEVRSLSPAELGLGPLELVAKFEE